MDKDTTVTQTQPAPTPEPVHKVEIVQPQAAPKPPAVSAAETLTRVDNWTNGIADRLEPLFNQTGPIALTDLQRSNMRMDIDRLRAAGKEAHNPTAEPPHNPPASPAFMPAPAQAVPQPGPTPNNDPRLAEASTAGVAGTPAVPAIAPVPVSDKSGDTGAKK
jgi:hypothetical protein